MPLFDIVPPELFSLLSSSNRSIYTEALDVLYDAFRENLKIPKSKYFSMLRSRLENSLAESAFDEDGIDSEEAQDLSGRARFLIRKLREKGWIDLEHGSDFEEYIILPDYSIRLLELFRSLTAPVTSSGFSYVYETYSTLRMADEEAEGGAYERTMALYGSYDKTMALVKLLKTVYHNINRFCQQQLDMSNINDVLAAHFNDFLQRIVEAYIRPLKIKDSVPKYKVPILQILDSWMEDEHILLAMANAALADKRFASLEECRSDLIRKIFEIKFCYENFETEYLNEIDQKVRKYTRATTQKIEYLTNNDRSVRGNLSYLLSALAKGDDDVLERIQPVFQLCEQSYLCEKSLYTHRRARKRMRLDPILIDEQGADLRDAAAEEFGAIINSPYAKKQVRAYMERFMDGKQIAYSGDFSITDNNGYVLSLLAVLSANERGSFYTAEILEDPVVFGKYHIPQVRFVRKE